VRRGRSFTRRSPGRRSGRPGQLALLAGDWLGHLAGERRLAASSVYRYRRAIEKIVAHFERVGYAEWRQLGVHRLHVYLDGLRDDRQTRQDGSGDRCRLSQRGASCRTRHLKSAETHHRIPPRERARISGKQGPEYPEPILRCRRPRPFVDRDDATLRASRRGSRAWRGGESVRDDFQRHPVTQAPEARLVTTRQVV